MKRNFFVAIYGITNIGKTTQQGILKLELEKQYHSAAIVTYQIDSLQSRVHELDDLILKHDVVIAEIHTETAMSSEKSEGIDKETLEEMGSIIRKANISILLDGKRFSSYGSNGCLSKLNIKHTERIRNAHQEIAEKLGWYIIDAKRSREAVHRDIWNNVFLEITGVDKA